MTDITAIRKYSQGRNDGKKFWTYGHPEPLPRVYILSVALRQGRILLDLFMHSPARKNQLQRHSPWVPVLYSTPTFRLATIEGKMQINLY